MALLLLALTGCADIPQARTEKEIRQIAREEGARIASAVDGNAIRSEEQGSQIAALESRVSSLERDNRNLRAEIDSLRNELDTR